MTDIPQSHSMAAADNLHTSDEARKRLAKRYAAERRFKFYGIAAIFVAAGFLVLLLTTIISQGLPAFTYNYLSVPVNFSEVDPNDPGAADYNKVIRDGLKEELPFAGDRRNRRVLYGLVSNGSNILLRNEVINDPSMISSTRDVSVPLSDFADLYVKGLITGKTLQEGSGIASPVGTEGTVKVLSTSNDFEEILAEVKAELAENAQSVRNEIEGKTRSLRSIEAQLDTASSQLQGAGADDRSRLESRIASLTNSQTAVMRQIETLTADAEGLESRAQGVNQQETLTTTLPSYLLHINGGVIKIEKVDATGIEGEAYIPLESDAEAATGTWSIEQLAVPESSRKFSDKEIAWTDRLAEKGLVSNRMNSIFFTSGASREPEMAGIWGAVVGSFFTMLVTLLMSFPIGVAAAIYLEEFAPKNRLTHLIEVNINNLAAVPSIVFGLLGLAVFLNLFGLPRSAPLVGGMVLALMTLPTIIIASRAALKAVPPSIREAALGVGASKQQAVFHHVLPLAMPGILTGTIIGMAQALGETAPLLMIGMVAFIVDIPGGPLDPATVLPVQIYMWADFPEPAFQQKTSAAIMVLLGFLVAMNGIAIILRKRFERRW